MPKGPALFCSSDVLPFRTAENILYIVVGNSDQRSCGQAPLHLMLPADSGYD